MRFVRFAIPITGILLMWAAAYSGLWKLVQNRLVELILGILLMGTCVYFDLWPLAPVAAMVTAYGLIRRCGPYYALPALLLLVMSLSFFLTGSAGLSFFLPGSGDLPRFDVLRGTLGAAACLGTLVVTAWMCSEVLIVHRGGDRRAARRMMTSLLVAPAFPTESPLRRFFAEYDQQLRALQIIHDGRVIHSMPPSEDFRMPGPGILEIRAGNAAVLERSGKITRVVGPGLYLTEPWEHLSAIVDLSSQSRSWVLEDVLTKDMIPLKVEFTVQYRIMIDVLALTTKAEYQLDENAIRRAILTTAGWHEQMGILAVGILHDTIATRFLEEIYDPRSLRFSSGVTPRVPLQHELRDRLNRETQLWGIETIRVTLHKIMPQVSESPTIPELRRFREEDFSPSDKALRQEGSATTNDYGHEAVQRALTMALRGLAILEEQAAGHTALDMPAHLRIELEKKRKEVSDLEARLKELEE